MKKLFCSIAMALSLVLPMAPLTLTTGCESFQKATLQTMISVHKTTDAGYMVWIENVHRQLKAGNFAATNDVPKVGAAYREFQDVYNVGLAMLSFNTNAPAPEFVKESSAKVIKLTK